MERNEYISYIKSAFEQNSLGDLIDNEKASLFCDLSNLLIETNKITNLTAITDEKEIILKHYIDCAAVSKLIPEDACVIDIGCGAGFPSLPLAICRPDLSVTSLDSTGKKIDFVNMAIAHLGLNKSKAVCARAEEFVSENREVYDACVSRAVARLNMLAELCLPFVRVDGTFIAMKSSKGADELAEAARGVATLGGRHAETVKVEFCLEDQEIQRELQVYVKAKHTPNQYPRKYAQILKKPL